MADNPASPDGKLPLDEWHLTRRSFLKDVGTAGVAAAFSSRVVLAQSPQAPVEANDTADIEGAIPVSLTVNGVKHHLKVDPRATLLDCLRDRLELTGTKKGCDHGQCGACTVHVNSRRVNSCLSFAAMHDGDEITTIEGIGQPDNLHPLQEAFVEHDGYQCGYCTSGQIMSGVALLKEPVGPDDADVKEMMSGNICRCGAYQNIVAAIQQCRRKAQLAIEPEIIAMELFQLIRPQDAAAAIDSAAQSKTAQQGATVRYVAGGTTLIDLMKLNVETPRTVLDINRLPLSQIERTSDGGLKIGALVRNSDLANHEMVKSDYPVLSQALLSGASAQLRNMATTSGNLLQRTRCIYFRDTAMPCNKREPGSGCPAIGGFNRTLAILGTSEHCIATNPSDMNVALIALEATVHIQGKNGVRAVPVGDFHLLPGDTPDRETVLEAGDLITDVTLPPPSPGNKSLYLKLRDRASYEFALASAAVIITTGSGKITRARIAMGGVGTKPWRMPAAEAELVNQPIDPKVFRKAAEAALQDAKPQSQNAFKIELARRCLVQALKEATA